MIDLKKIAQMVVLVTIALFIFIALFYFCCEKPKPISYDEAHRVVEEIYRPPVVKVPFVKQKKAPVSKENLPIPEKNVAQTIEIVQTDITPGESIKATIVIDKKGNVYTTKDTPEDVKVKVTKWKPKFIGFESKLGYSLAYNVKSYHCLSLDLLRVGDRFHLGADAGIGIEKGCVSGCLFGLSGKYDISKIGIMGKDLLRFRALVGYDFLHQRTYIGIGVRW